MSIFRKISAWSLSVVRVFRNEIGLMIHDVGILLFFVVLPLLYPIVYTLIYNPEVVRELPIAIVDDSRTASSRSLVQRASASPSLQIYAYCTDMSEARQLMAEHKVFGVMHITRDYERDIAKGDIAHVNFYSDMSLLLRYRTFVAALTDLQIEVIQDITGEKIALTGLESLAGEKTVPVASEAHMLGDTEQGFASFVIPGIVILILHQSMLLGIGLLGGTSCERRRRNGGIDPKEEPASPMATIWGRALAYTVFYFPMTLYILLIIPEIFSLPHYGAPADYLLFVFPLLLSTAFLGQALNYFMKERESCFIIIVFTSVLFLFLSGLTWPRYAMSDLWICAGDLVPAVWGVEGFIRINSNSADLPEVATAFRALWILAGVYMIAAWSVVKKLNCNR